MNNQSKSKIVIVTHNGQFHADDVFGTAVLSLLLEETHEIEIIRTRDKEKIEQADYVLDTGNIFDPEKNRFDHHQTGGAGIRENGIPYASFGLIWKKYGEALSGSKEVADELEQMLVLSIDARDNGINVSTSSYPGVLPYEIRDIVTAFRITWKEDKVKLYDNFISILKIAKEIIKREIKNIKDIQEAKKLVLDIYNKTEDKRLLILDTYYPYSAVINNMPEVLLVIYPDLSDGNWSIETIPEAPFSYTSKILFPENWGGKNNSNLEEATGVKGSIFCHNRRFITVAKNKEAAIELAHIALKEANK